MTARAVVAAVVSLRYIRLESFIRERSGTLETIADASEDVLDRNLDALEKDVRRPRRRRVRCLDLASLDIVVPLNEHHRKRVGARPNRRHEVIAEVAAAKDSKKNFSGLFLAQFRA